MDKVSAVHIAEHDDWQFEVYALSVRDDIRLRVLTVHAADSGACLAITVQPFITPAVCDATVFRLMRECGRPLRISLFNDDGRLLQQLMPVATNFNIALNHTRRSSHRSMQVDSLLRSLTRACGDLPRYHAFPRIRRAAERWRRAYNRTLRPRAIPPKLPLNPTHNVP